MGDPERPAVVVVDADPKRCREVCALLGRLNYRATALHSLPDLVAHLPRLHSGVVLLDLDTVPVDNHFFRDLKKRNLEIIILGISSLPYHAGLEEAMGSHIYACLSRPLDAEELEYWLKSISESFANKRNASEI